jgi:hypothetical protein
MPQLIADCLNNIFEYLDDDKNTLYSCLLVNHQWCEVAVRILWRNAWYFKDNRDYKPHVPLSVINTLIACLPKESKDFLEKEKFYIISPTQKPPLFNYPSFIKIITIYGVYQMIEMFPSDSRDYSSWYCARMHSCLLLELLKMFMNQVSSLKSLDYYSAEYKFDNINEFIYTPGAKICLSNLTELWCRSDICSDFFYQMSQICHNIQSLTIKFICSISDGLTDLICSQNNLKNVSLEKADDEVKAIIPSLTSLTKFSLTLTELVLDECYVPLSFVAMFTNLQVLWFFNYDFDELDQLQCVHFTQLKTLKFVHSYPEIEMLIIFLEINGKNLTEFHVSENPNNSLNSAIAKFCPNLRILSIIFEKDEFETFKLILNNCQNLEIIRFRYFVRRPNLKTFFKILTKYAQKNFYELSIDWYYIENNLSFEKFCEELEEFFINWKERIPQKSLTLVITNCYGNSVKFEKYMKIVLENYTKMGIIRKITTKEYIAI